MEFLINRIRAFQYAFRGQALLFKGETHMKIHLFNTLWVLPFFYWLKISSTEWALTFVAIFLVYFGEGINTAIEKLCDHLHPEKSASIRNIKDIAAGASLFCSFCAAFVGLTIVFNHLERFQ